MEYNYPFHPKNLESAEVWLAIANKIWRKSNGWKANLRIESSERMKIQANSEASQRAFMLFCLLTT